jgi:hypothetical protein
MSQPLGIGKGNCEKSFQAASANLRGPRFRPFGQPRFRPLRHGMAPLRFAAAIFAGLLLRPSWLITSASNDFFIPRNIRKRLANHKRNNG